MRTSAHGTGYDVGSTTMFTPPLSPPLNRITQGLQEYWLMPQRGCRKRKLSDLLYQHNLKWIERCGDSTGFSRHHNGSSWRQARKKASPYHWYRHHPSMYYWMRTTQRSFKHIVHWLTQVTICTYLPTSAKLSPRVTSWQYPTLTTIQYFPPSPLPHHRTDRRTGNNLQCEFKSYSPCANTGCPRENTRRSWTNRFIWSPQPRSSRTLQKHLERLAGDYLGPKGPLRQAMATYSLHIDRFKRQYDKNVSGDRTFRKDLVDCIHKHVQVFSYSCKTAFLDDVGMSALSKFVEL